MCIINEPTAASLAYAFDKKKDQKIAVFDLGGGTFRYLRPRCGRGRSLPGLATNGDTHLGGDNFDQVLIDWLADEFKKENGIDLRKDHMAMQRLKEAAERAKKDLIAVAEHRYQPAVHHHVDANRAHSPGSLCLARTSSSRWSTPGRTLPKTGSAAGLARRGTETGPDQ